MSASLNAAAPYTLKWDVMTLLWTVCFVNIDIPRFLWIVLRTEVDFFSIEVSYPPTTGRVIGMLAFIFSKYHELA